IKCPITCLRDHPPARMVSLAFSSPTCRRIGSAWSMISTSCRLLTFILASIFVSSKDAVCRISLKPEAVPHKKKELPHAAMAGRKPLRRVCYFLKDELQPELHLAGAADNLGEGAGAGNQLPVGRIPDL